MKSQFWSPERPEPLETHRGAGAVRRTTSALQISRLMLPPALLPQELRRYDPLGVKLQLLVLTTLAYPRLSRLPDNPLFLVQSTKCLRLCRRKRCEPSREERLLQGAKTQNCNALTIHLNSKSSVPLRQDFVQSERDPPQN